MPESKKVFSKTDLEHRITVTEASLDVHLTKHCREMASDRVMGDEGVPPALLGWYFLLHIFLTLCCKSIGCPICSILQLFLSWSGLYNPFFIARFIFAIQILAYYNLNDYLQIPRS